MKASAALVRRRDEVLSRASDNPFVEATSRANLEATFHRFVKRFRDADADADDAGRLALTALTHSSGLSPEHPQLIEQLSHQQRTRELAPLRVGEPYVISPAMHATVAAAAETLAADDVARWRSDDLLTEQGVLLLPHIQLVHETGKRVPDEIVMISWTTGSYESPLDSSTARALYMTAWFDGDGPVDAPEYTAARNTAARHGYPLPPFGVAASCRHELDISDTRIERAQGSLIDWVDGAAGGQESLSTTIGEHSGEVIDVSYLAGWLGRYVFAFMGLAQQRIATVQRFRDMRALAAKPLQYDDVRVVQLRSFSPIGDPEQLGPPGQYRHRWVVRMHKVNQWYPSEGVHKIIWRGPYIKGPADAPLLAGEKVHALVR